MQVCTSPVDVQAFLPFLALYGFIQQNDGLLEESLHEALDSEVVVREQQLSLRLQVDRRVLTMVRLIQCQEVIVYSGVEVAQPTL